MMPLTALLVLLLGCASNSSSSQGTGQAHKDSAKKHPVTAVTLTADDGTQLLVQAEVVSKGEDRTRGLMFREHLPEGEGMLFVFQEEEEHPFWMKNTLIPLDMLFIAADKTVAGIVHDAKPKSLESRTVGVPSMYVLEVPGGYCLKHNISRGSKVSFELP